MQEIFYEETANVQHIGSAKTKYAVLNIFSIIFYVLAVLWFVLLFCFFEFGKGNIFINLLVAFVPLIIFIFFGVFLGILKEKYYMDFDYTFISGSIRISSIVKNTKRRTVIKFECSSIEKMGNFESGTFNKYNINKNIKKKILTLNIYPADNKKFYYLVVNLNNEKYLLILECTETFINNIIKFTNRTILEDGFLKNK